MADFSSLGSTPNVSTGAFSPAVDQLIRQAGSRTENSKIDKAAKDFESILLSSWLQQAEESFGSVPGGDEEDADAGKEQLQGVAMQALGTAMAAAGGVGLAKMIATHLHEAEDAEVAKSAGVHPAHTE